MLDKSAQKELLKFSRTVLENYFQGKNTTVLPENQFLLEKAGAFVTLTINGQLRGCIGNFSANQPLWEAVKDMSLAAAFDDPRFSPLKKEELKEVEIEISVLSPRKKISSYQEIVMGKHGVYIERDGRGGTFLPQVAEEFNNDRDAFLAALCLHKAGLPPDSYKDPKTNLYIYTCQILKEKMKS